jgi:hypothetical protein
VATPVERLPAASVPDLEFAVEDVRVLPYAAVPTLAFALRVDNRSGELVQSLLLHVQVRIAATSRPYDEAARERLAELFGAPAQWGETLRSLLWTHATLVVPRFEGSTMVELHVLCTYDFDVTAAKYMHALQDGDVPLEFLFSGNAFYAGEGGLLQTARISWNAEAVYRMPIRVWRELMQHYFPDSAWLRLRTDTFDRLYAYRASRALTGWEETFEALLDAAEADGRG